MRVMLIAVLCTELTEQLWRSNGANGMDQMVFKDGHKDFPRGRTAESILEESVLGSCFPNVILLEKDFSEKTLCVEVLCQFSFSIPLSEQPYPT